MNLPYVVDINRDTQLQDFYSDRPHTLIVGVARIAGTDYRFRIYQYYSGEYREITQQEVDTSLPVLFKPTGSPKPEANYIASDADYVDYITELMGGFAIPGFLKEYRKGKQYLFCGLRMLRDTERMVLSDIIYAAGEPAGWRYTGASKWWKPGRDLKKRREKREEKEERGKEEGKGQGAGGDGGEDESAHLGKAEVERLAEVVGLARGGVEQAELWVVDDKAGAGPNPLANRVGVVVVHAEAGQNLQPAFAALVEQDGERLLAGVE